MTKKMGLELDPRTREEWLEIFGRFALEEIEKTGRVSAAGIGGAEAIRIASEVSVPVPEQPLEGGPARILECLARAAEASFVTTSPGYLAYVPGGGLYTGALADFVAGCLNRFTGLAVEAPALCRLEADVLEWLMTEFGWGDVDSARGVLTSGGSLANFGAVVAARHDCFGEDGDLRRGTAYVSSQTHHSVAKAIRLAGFPLRNVRPIDVDETLRMRVDKLDEAVRGDLDHGLTPFLVVSTAGTTNTGAIDPLADIDASCRAYGVWHHVDAAYGGGFVLCERGRELLAGIARADSITIDPHKSLFLPTGTGCLLVRDGDKLRAAHELDADYLAVGHEGEPPSPAHYGAELSRPFRGLRLWLSLMLYGAQPFRTALDEKLELAERFNRGLEKLRTDHALPIEITQPPQLSTVAFRLERDAGESLASWNSRNVLLLDAINASGRVFLSKTSLPVADGQAQTLRMCALSYRCREEDIDACLEVLERCIAEARSAAAS